MEKKLCKICEDILKDESKIKEFTEIETVDEMYEYFLKQIPNLSEEEFDDFVFDALENYEKIQDVSNLIGDNALENVAGGLNLTTKIASGVLALTSLFASTVGATSEMPSNMNPSVNTSASKNLNATEPIKTESPEKGSDNTSFFSKYFNKEKLNNIKLKVSDKFKKTKNWIKNHKLLVSGVTVAILAAPVIYSNIRYAKPRNLTGNVVGETDAEISKYSTKDFTSSDLQYRENEAQIKSKVDEILKEMNQHGCKNDYEKAVFLHDYIYKHCEFDMGRALDFFANTDRFRGKGCHDASGCLLYDRAVCSGISEAYALLLSSVGVECKCIYGVSYKMQHAWNIVKINGQWYHVDITWDLLFKAMHGKYSWFMCTKKEIEKDHKPDMA